MDLSNLSNEELMALANQNGFDIELPSAPNVQMPAVQEQPSMLTPFEMENRDALIAANERALEARRALYPSVEQNIKTITDTGNWLTGVGGRLASNSSFGLIGDEAISSSKAALSSIISGQPYEAEYNKYLQQQRAAEDFTREQGGVGDFMALELAPRVLSGMALPGALRATAAALPSRAGQIATSVVNAAKVTPGTGFLAARAKDVLPMALMGGTEGFMNARGDWETRTEEALKQGALSGAISGVASPFIRAFQGARGIGESIEQSQEAKALGLRAADVAKSAAKNPKEYVEGGETLIQKQVGQLLKDVDAPTAGSSDELMQRILARRDQLGQQYDEIFDTAQKILGARKIRITGNDVRRLESWVNSPAVPSADKKQMLALLKETVSDINEGLGKVPNPFKQLQTDRSSFNKAYDKLTVESIDKLGKQIRKTLGAKLQASLNSLPKSSEVRWLGRDLMELDKAYAPLAALRNTVAKAIGRDAVGMSLDDALKAAATTGGIGTFIQQAGNAGGAKAATAAALFGIPAMMASRTPAGMLSIGRSARSIGNVLGRVGQAGEVVVPALTRSAAGNFATYNTQRYADYE